MGGSSALNGMVYVRGNKKDYDNWADMGNTGWDWKSLQPFFLKSENFRGTPLPGSSKLITPDMRLSVRPERLPQPHMFTHRLI